MTFEEQLDHLLLERAEVRRLLGERMYYRRMADSTKARDKENELEDLVRRPLRLTKREKPSAWGIIADAAQAFTEDPGRSWATLVSGSNVEAWPQRLKDRIQTLCGSLDTILLQMRSEEQTAAALG